MTDFKLLATSFIHYCRSEAAETEGESLGRGWGKADLLTCAIKALGDSVKEGVLRGQEPFHHWHDD